MANAAQPKPVKPPRDVKELHFFPGVHVMVWAVNGKAVLKADAWGGEEPKPGVHYDVMKPRPTTPGRYVVHSYAPYRTNTWPLSKIAWGTKLALDPTGAHVLFESGGGSARWTKVSERIPGLSKGDIRQLYRALFADDRSYDRDGDGIPDKWVFNDFGAMAVRYFKDANRNLKLDQGEHLSGEMIHTTPANEAQVARGQAVTLEPSHGCIHISPKQRDALHGAGAFDRGTQLVIHAYTEALPPAFK